MTAPAADPPPDPASDPSGTIKARARQALRRREFDWVGRFLARGVPDLDELTENLRIYQAELEIQNDELRNAQLIAEQMATRYTMLFARIPLAALVVDQHGLILDANQAATRLFGLLNRHLRHHFLRRLVDPESLSGLDATLSTARVQGAAAAACLTFHTAAGDGFAGELHIERLPEVTGEEPRFICALVDISEHLRQQTAIEHAHWQLRESETRYRILADYSADWDCWLGPDGEYRYVSPACQAICGHAPETFMTRPETMRELIHPEDQPRWEAHWRQVLDHGQDRPHACFELRLLRPDGGLRWIEHQCRPVHGADGTYLGRRGVNRDITVRKQGELALRRDQRRAEALLALPQAAEGVNEIAFMQRAQEMAEELTDSQISFIHFVNDDQSTIELVTWSRATLEHYCQAAFDRHYPVAQAGIWADALRQRAPVLCNDYARQPGRRGLPAGHAELRRFVCVPVIEGGRVRMLAGVGNRVTPYTETDVESVQLMANAIWRIVRQRRVEAALRQTARAFESAAEGVVITDAEIRILSVNRAFTEITGYTETAVMGQSLRILESNRQPPDFYDALWTTLHATGRWQGEVWNRRLDGAAYPAWLTVANVTDEGGAVTHYVAVFGDISELKQSQERLAFLAHHDPLTQLPNRALFKERLDQQLRLAHRHGQGLAVLFIDLDRFKIINDSLGHAVGDELLCTVARRMQALIRGSDTLARVGGDEFVMLLTETGTAQEASTVASKLLQMLAQPIEIESHELYVTASIGISFYPADGDRPDLLLRHADLAMYRAKSLGRNAFHFYQAELAEAAVERLRLGNALRGALTRGEFLLHYQPQVNLETGTLTALEALVRWQHPQQGLVPPDRFVPVAEEIGLIGDLGAWVLRAACEQMRHWDAAGIRIPRLAVNLAVQQLERDSFIQLVAGTLAATGLAPDRLELEVTESMIMRQTERAIDTLQGLRALGVGIAVDDFGTGYSSLIYLRRLPLSRLKIDYSFVRDLGSSLDDEIIVRTIIGLGRSLGLEVIAEGVETAVQAEFLRREGCRYAQGYLFSHPLPPAEIAVGRWEAAG